MTAPSILRNSGLVAGLGIAALVLAGCASSATSTKGSSGLPKLHIGGTSTGVAPEAAAAPAPAANGAAMAPMIPARMFGGYVLTGSLPDGPSHAPIWTWSSSQPTQADVQKLATVLGLDGTPKRHAHGWELTTATADLRVSDEPGYPWSYDKTDLGGCPTYQVDVDDPGDVVNGCAASIAAGAAQPADGPDEAATKAAAASLLAALGVGGDTQFGVGAPSSTLTVSPRIGGLPTQGIDTTVSVDANGVNGATGQLEAPTAGADYPLRTAAAAFKDLNDEPRPMMLPFCGPIPVDGSAPAGPINMEGPQPDTEGGVVSPAQPQSPVAIPVPASPPPTDVTSAAPDSPLAPSSQAPISSPVPCPTPEPTKITGAVLGLQAEYGATDDGAPILAPAWFFTTADSSYPMAIVAIDPSYLEGPSTDVASASAASAGPGSAGPGSAGPATPVPFPPAARVSVAASPAS